MHLLLCLLEKCERETAVCLKIAEKWLTKEGEREVEVVGENKNK